jgi:hypothetical protein
MQRRGSSLLETLSLLLLLLLTMTYPHPVKEELPKGIKPLFDMQAKGG